MYSVWGGLVGSMLHAMGLLSPAPPQCGGVDSGYDYLAAVFCVGYEFYDFFFHSGQDLVLYLACVQHITRV